ncbi:hypothetical protein [Brevundimonas balnearis]|uniref:Uncharacterized protein n=1 Tax=Brevundimonas balnearis TaxID=1572858 RepID=A0ABV6R1G0_9CAUL
MSASVRPFLIGLAACLAAGPALAQSAPRPHAGQAAGLRYLTWTGKRPDPARTPPAAAVAAPPSAEPAPVPRPRVHGSPASPRPNTLTPASAWLPTAAPATPSPLPPAPVVEPARPSPEPPPAPGPSSSPVEALAAVVEADPMAPRADAPIHRIAPQPVAAAGGESTRYYSVHRAAGQTPDPVAIPDPVYLDQAPIDLAEPEGPPVVMRDGQGRLIPAEPADDSTLP